MDSSVVTDVIAGLSIEPNRPRFTGYTEAGRTELSGTALLNWASKTAGLLIDELGGQRGDVVCVTSPAGWQTAGILLGALWAGMCLTDDPSGPALAAFVPPGGDADADDVFVVSGHPLGLPADDIHAGQRDYSNSVRVHADRFTPPWGPSDIVLRTGGYEQSAAALRGALRAPSGLGAGQRVMTVGTWTLEGRDPRFVGLLLRPLVSRASVIHSADLDAADDAERWADRARTEKADFCMGVNIPGVPRIG
jgi:uncharacterized protein (TIGR03089 family)